MAEINLNVTEARPEIPSAASAPKKVAPSIGTPLTQMPTIITSRKAREQTQKNLDMLTSITGKSFSL